MTDPAAKRDSQEADTLHMQLSARMQEPDVIPNPSGTPDPSPTFEGCHEDREQRDRRDSGAVGGGGGSSGAGGPPPLRTPLGVSGGFGADGEAPAAAVEADHTPTIAAPASAAQPAVLGRPKHFTGGDTGLPLGFRGVWDEPYDEAAARDTLSRLYQHWCSPMRTSVNKYLCNLQSINLNLLPLHFGLRHLLLRAELR